MDWSGFREQKNSFTLLMTSFNACWMHTTRINASIVMSVSVILFFTEMELVYAEDTLSIGSFLVDLISKAKPVITGERQRGSSCPLAF
ncbi:hypothetical protein A0H81_08661 [Grifola frondosa]|uniref:Uncharacterized protein n=1 Tax=Grifola frondosa TaxID=5627 RepID=A0A1C7M3F2_GRIFR|nr:hypothetical protein A0H81_08661 [Grifola frondosa]